MKFVDEVTLAEAMIVKEYVLPNPDPNPPRSSLPWQYTACPPVWPDPNAGAAAQNGAVLYV